MRGVSVGVLAVLTIFISGSGAAIAADCNLLLKDGVFDQYDVTSDRHRYEHVRHSFCSQNFRESQSARSWAASAQVPIYGVLAKFGLKSDWSNFEQSRDSFCSSDEKTTLVDDHFKANVRTADKALLDAFIRCAEAENGLHVFLKTTADPKLFHLVARYRAPAIEDSARTVTGARLNIGSSGVTCERVPSSFVDASLLCSRKDERTPIVISFTSRVGNVPLELPAFGGNLPANCVALTRDGACGRCEFYPVAYPGIAAGDSRMFVCERMPTDRSVKVEMVGTVDQPAAHHLRVRSDPSGTRGPPSGFVVTSLRLSAGSDQSSFDSGGRHGPMQFRMSLALRSESGTVRAMLVVTGAQHSCWSPPSFTDDGWCSADLALSGGRLVISVEE